MFPQQNSLPHDPAVAPDGSLWYTGQHSNTLGRLNPETGKIKEYPLKVSDSGPYGLMADKEGNIWFTANCKGYIGKIDPTTGKMMEYPIPDSTAGAFSYEKALELADKVGSKTGINVVTIK